MEIKKLYILDIKVGDEFEVKEYHNLSPVWISHIITQNEVDFINSHKDCKINNNQIRIKK